ncbi:unnamed protein product, partial [marine sediment metagenome]
EINRSPPFVYSENKIILTREAGEGWMCLCEISVD